MSKQHLAQGVNLLIVKLSTALFMCFYVFPRGLMYLYFYVFINVIMSVCMSMYCVCIYMCNYKEFPCVWACLCVILSVFR